jgi:hypothetical protein
MHPSGEWGWDQYGLNVSFVSDGPEEFLVGIDVRPAAFEGDGARQCWLQRHCYRFRYIFNISWLQSRSAAAKHRKDWEPFEELDNRREESVVWPEHHGRTDEKRIGERCPSQQDLPQVHGDQYDRVSDRCGRYRAPIPATRRTATDCPVRGYPADEAMQRLRAEPRAVRARAIPFHGR